MCCEPFCPTTTAGISICSATTASAAWNRGSPKTCRSVCGILAAACTSGERSEAAKLIFTETRLKGVFAIDLAPQADDRGFFARSYCWREFEQHGLNPRVVQCNVSYNRRRGTLRGMHYQTPPD